MPDASLSYLVDLLFEVGPTESRGMGPGPLSFQELNAWQQAMRRRLQPWEVGFIRRLSMVYAAQSVEAEDPDCAPPWVPEERISEPEARAVTSSLRAALRGMGG